MDNTNLTENPVKGLMWFYEPTKAGLKKNITTHHLTTLTEVPKMPFTVW